MIAGMEDVEREVLAKKSVAIKVTAAGRDSSIVPSKHKKLLWTAVTFV